MDNKHGGKREGAGRRPGPVEDRTKRRSVYLTEAEWNHCDREWTQGVGASEYVRRLIEADMKRVAQAQ